MAKQKKTDLSVLADDQLAQQLTEAKGQLQRHRINHVVSALENPNEISNARKNIARILTEISRRELSLQAQKLEASNS